MTQQTDITKAGLIVWNTLLTTVVIAMSFRLATIGAESDAVHKEQVLLMARMVETDEALMRASENHSTAIMANSGAISSNSEVNVALFEWVGTLSEKLTRDVAEIYQGHIVPIRAILMEGE